MELKSSGFSLVEVALALAVMGLIGAMTFPLLSHMLTQQKVVRTETILETARTEILGYTLSNHALPENMNTVGHRVDGWRTSLEYQLAQEVDEGEELCAFFDANGTSSLQIEISGESVIEEVAFILVSPGANKNLQINLSENPVTIPAPGSEVDGRKYDDLYTFLTTHFLRASLDCPDTEP
jgi:prepilin-type N-terminal cleavage/methylation domain-containing protein